MPAENLAMDQLQTTENFGKQMFVEDRTMLDLHEKSEAYASCEHSSVENPHEVI